MMRSGGELMQRYIDADALWMDIIHNMDYCEDILEFIEAQPTADVRENVHSFWEDGYRSCWDGTRKYFRQCHNCGYERDDDYEDLDTLFCPNCGAEMKGESDE